MNAELELIRQAISKFTTTEYEFTKPIEGFPIKEGDLSWLIVSPFKLKESSHSPAPFIWEDNQGILYVESVKLGDTSRWIEEAYGEKGAIASMKLERQFSEGDFRTVLKRRFPKVHRRLLLLERVISESASRRSVELQVAEYRNKFIMTFHALSRVEVAGLDAQAKIEKIRLSIDAIREAVSEIDKHEAKRTH